MLQIQNTKLDFKKKARSRIGSFENAEHVPGGGDIEVAILNQMLITDKLTILRDDL